MDKSDPAIERERLVAEISDAAARDAYWGAVTQALAQLVLALPPDARIPRLEQFRILVRASREGLRDLTFPDVPAEWSMLVAGEIEDRYDALADEFLERLDRLEKHLSDDRP